MKFIQTFLPEQDINSIQDGLRLFIRLLSLAEKEELEAKWQPDEYDLISALYTTRDFIVSTSGFVGCQKYRNTKYDWAKDVRELIVEILLDGPDEKTKLRNRRRFLNMYHLVIGNIVDVLSTLDHLCVINHINDITEDLVNMVYTNDYYGTYDDAVIVRESIRERIRQKEFERVTPRCNHKDFDFDYFFDEVEELNFES